ncbi:MAG TPA: T9SS type A sorting domain-containing protein [Flavobacteriales bacterium]|nr:T9SS type A sorting domain-containing protein [Flavobacteriales bacterium]
MRLLLLSFSILLFSTTYSQSTGCTDTEACNYDDAATDDDGSCWYAEMYYNCDGNCINDTDGDGVCDELEISGCTDPKSCNYDVTATEENDSCIFLSDPCDDGDPNTVDDVIQEDCECVGIPISLVDELEALSVLIYPNPASSNLTIDLGDLTGVSTTFKLYDSSSKLVFEKLSTYYLTIDVSCYAKGLYTLELSTSDRVLRSQVVIK